MIASRRFTWGNLIARTSSAARGTVPFSQRLAPFTWATSPAAKIGTVPGLSSSISGVLAAEVEPKRAGGRSGQTGKGETFSMRGRGGPIFPDRCFRFTICKIPRHSREKASTSVWRRLIMRVDIVARLLPCRNRIVCHCWLAQQCRKHGWTSQPWHPEIAMKESSATRRFFMHPAHGAIGVSPAGWQACRESAAPLRSAAAAAHLSGFSRVAGQSRSAGCDARRGPAAAPDRARRDAVDSLESALRRHLGRCDCLVLLQPVAGGDGQLECLRRYCLNGGGSWSRWAWRARLARRSGVRPRGVGRRLPGQSPAECAACGPAGGTWQAAPNSFWPGNVSRAERPRQGRGSCFGRGGLAQWNPPRADGAPGLGAFACRRSDLPTTLGQAADFGRPDFLRLVANAVAWACEKDVEP